MREHIPFEEIVKNPDFELRHWHKNEYGDYYTLVFEHKTSHGRKTYSNVAVNSIPPNIVLDPSKEMYGTQQQRDREEYEATREEHPELADILNDPDYELVLHHKNIRGTYTLVFEHKTTHCRKTFGAVTEEHLPSRIYEQVKGDIGPERHVEYHFDDIANSPDWTLVASHRNIRGSYTLVFQNKNTGEKVTFATVSREHIPDKLLATVETSLPASATPVKEHHYFEEIANDDNYQLINSHQNIRGNLTVVFSDKRTGARFTFANVDPEHIPDRLRNEVFRYSAA